MAELMVVGFEGKRRAAEVLEQLETLDSPSTIDLKDAVAVYRTDSGKLRVDGGVWPTTKEGAVGGAFVGAMLGGMIGLAVAPFTGGASVAAAALSAGALSLGLGGAVIGADDAEKWKKTYGVSDDFVEQVGGMVQPGQSAVFVLALAPEPDKLAEQFRGYGGKILHTTLSPEAAAKLQQLMTPQVAAAR